MTNAKDNRTTELHEKLTERGVEYREDNASYTFVTHWTDSLGRGCSFIEEVYDGESKTIFVSEPSARKITPEQAIAATLADDDYELKMDALLCRLTNGKFSKSRAYDLDFMESCVNEEFEILYADDLNATLGRECKVVASSTNGLTTENPKQLFQLSCGHTFKIYGLDVPVACPVCGKAVKR